MDYPGNPTKLTTDAILEHYKRSGLKPLQKLTMNSLIRETFLCLKENHAFYVDLVNRGIIIDDGGEKALRTAYEQLEEYVEHINECNYS